ncbi:electron transport complex subunit RsxG [Chitinimonas lacunae]|uniref:Ion-translocating oxidoreductase complex subunit G n=1 Tax=Chitinimonas lacunae TaxID=1963018 RepID=A0ABV8MV44_9NEIS
MNEALRHAVRSALTLALFALAFTALLAATHGCTRQRIEAEATAMRRAELARVLPAGGFDNDLTRDTLPLSAADNARLGRQGAGVIHLARRKGQPVAAVLELTAPDGYAGPIELLVGVAADGTVLGVRVLSHKETPGLGDYIEPAKSPWASQFRGRSLNEPAPEDWAVRRDGGVFDARAGATITPRAIVRALRAALELTAERRGQWFGVPHA